MEKMDGNLRDLLKKSGKLSEKESLEWIGKIANAYKSLYKSGIIHRDLKPENIVYRKNQNGELQFKLCDFGLSRDIIKTTEKMSNRLGTKAYVSPEQWHKKKYSSKADVYSLGAIHFELLNGSLKFPMAMDIISFPDF